MSRHPIASMLFVCGLHSSFACSDATSADVLDRDASISDLAPDVGEDAAPDVPDVNAHIWLDIRPDIAADISIDIADTTSPVTATIVFPPSSATTAASIIVRGTASPSVIAVAVASVAATSDDGYRHWSADVPLALGGNLLSIDLTTAAGKTHLGATVDIERFTSEVGLVRGSGDFPGRALGLGWDAASRRALASDDVGDGLYAIDPPTGLRTVLSNSESSDGPGSGFAIVRPTVLAARGSTAWVADPPLLIAIDLASGDRTVVPGPELGDISGVALDPANADHLLVLTSTSLVRLDPASGNRTVVSSDSVGRDPALADAVSLAVDDQGLVAYVLRVYQDVVIAVDLATGARSQILAAGGTPRFDDPHHIVWFEGALFVWNVDQLVRIDPATGSKTLLAGAGLPLISPYGVTASPLGLLAIDYVPEWETGPERAPLLFAIDPVVGTRVVLAR